MNWYIPTSVHWAESLFYKITVVGGAEFLYLFALAAEGSITIGSLLVAITGFFNLILTSVVAVFFAEDIFQQSLMILLFGIGLALTLIELIYTAGTIVAVKYCLMAVSFIALGLACSFDILDSDGIVG